MAGTAGFASGSLDMEAPHPPTQLTRRLNEGGGGGGGRTKTIRDREREERLASREIAPEAYCARVLAACLELRG